MLRSPEGAAGTIVTPAAAPPPGRSRPPAPRGDRARLGYGRRMMAEHVLMGGRYRLEGLIGRGGMASVWRATDIVLDRAVAVKRLHARLHDDPELAERFRREGTAVARLSHPNLVRLLDQGQDGDEPFLVFELVEGRDLKTMIRQEGRLAPREAASICSQVARALGAAHAAGVVHRDIKSHNVLVTPAGVAKLTDFGIARIIGGEDASLTRTGIVLGSSDYLAPEQAEGRQVERASDIYSLGVVLFEALTGRLPFQGENAVAVATKHVYEDAPDPRSVVPGIPRALGATCLRALEKRQSDRFPSADAFADALDGTDATRMLVPLDSTTRRIRAPRRRRRRAPAIVLAAAAAAAAGVGAWQGGVLQRWTDAAQGADAKIAFTPQDHDPFGFFTTGENPQEVSLVNDGNPATSWHTEVYRSADLGVLKPGVGLLLHLNGPTRVSDVTIRSDSPGGRLEILGPGDDAPGGRAILGQTTLPNGSVDVPIHTSQPVSELLLWFVELPPDPDGGYRASLGEVEVRGVANT
jgi:eukaryotic-like serine/threonine-protein kinase